MVDVASARREQVTRQDQRIANAKPELHVKLAHQREPNQRRVRNAPSDASPLQDDIRYLMMGEEIINPFSWCANRK